MRVYLIGYMGSGKSRTGAELSARLGWTFIDMDDLFEERYRITVPDFFDKYDETSFRNIEYKLLRETALNDNTVIATGGGTPCFFDNMDFINENGTSIYLKPGIGQLVTRLKAVRKKRPLLKDLKPDKLSGHILMQISAREQFYSRAHFTLEGPDISAENILHLLKVV